MVVRLALIAGFIVLTAGYVAAAQVARDSASEVMHHMGQLVDAGNAEALANRVAWADLRAQITDMLLDDPEVPNDRVPEMVATWVTPAGLAYAVAAKERILGAEVPAVTWIHDTSVVLPWRFAIEVAPPQFAGRFAVTVVLALRGGRWMVTEIHASDRHVSAVPRSGPS